MPSFVKAPNIWIPLDPVAHCRTWTAGNDASEVRKGTNASLLRAMAHAANQISTQGRIMFQCWRDDGCAWNAAGGADPLWQWVYLDTAKNGRTHVFDLQVLPRVAGSGTDSKVHREGDTSSTTAEIEEGTQVASSISYPEEIATTSFEYARGNRSDAADTEGLTAVNGATVAGLVVRDRKDTQLDPTSADYDIAPTTTPYSGQECVANALENVRSVVQALREDYLPIVGGWCANDCTTGNQPSTTGVTGIKCTSNGTYENLLDTNFSTRTNVSPGVTIWAEGFGRGNTSAATANKRVRIRHHLLAEVSGTGTGVVKFEGPTTHASNYTEIAVSAGTPTWLGGSGYNVDLDSTSSATTTTTARNKIDIFGKVTDGSTTMWVYGWLQLMINV